MKSMRKMMTQETNEKDLLVEFERRHIPDHFKEYYTFKRHNFFATIDQFPHIWNCFMRLDEIVLRELVNMQRASDPNLMFPMVLFLNAHAKMRIAFELACSACLTEAHSILRDAIESVAHANRLASEPKLLKPWLEKNDSEAAKKVFKQEFEHDKANRLFNGLPELHKLWKQCSEFGSHTNLESLISRFTINKTTTDLEFRLNYTGVDPRLLGPALGEMLLVFSEIEKTLFKLFETRLKLDVALADMRDKFDVEKEAARQWVIKTFNIQKPKTP
jgi:hypothetical protein